MLQVRSGRINIEAVLRLFILLGFALFFYVTIQSGKAQLYIHPRLVPYMKFGIGAMVLISIFIARTVLSPQRKKVNWMPYVFFIIPLISAFLLPARVMDTTGLSSADFKITQQANRTAGDLDDADLDLSADMDLSNEDAAYDNTENEDIPASDIESDSTGADSEENAELDSELEAELDSSGAFIDGPDFSNPELKLTGDAVVIEDVNFVAWNDELYYNLGKYEGKKIQITGAVFKNEDFKPDEFAVVRFMMSCCTADLQPVGQVCRYDEAGEMKPDTWIKVTGKIESMDYEGEKIPIITVENIEKAEKPADEYVYP